MTVQSQTEISFMVLQWLLPDTEINFDNQAMLIAVVEDWLNRPRSKVVSRPTKERPITEFICACDENQQFTLPQLVKVLKVDVKRPENLAGRPYLVVTLETERPYSGQYRRIIWLYGEPEPEVIGQLGLRVV